MQNLNITVKIMLMLFLLITSVINMHVNILVIILKRKCFVCVYFLCLGLSYPLSSLIRLNRIIVILNKVLPIITKSLVIYVHNIQTFTSASVQSMNVTNGCLQ